MARKTKKRTSFLVYSFFIILLIFGGIGYHYYQIIFVKPFSANVSFPDTLYIPTGSHFKDVKQHLLASGLLPNEDEALFEIIAEKKNLPRHIYPGRYIFRKAVSLNALINRLRTGKQDPVKIIINSNIRTLPDLITRVGEKLETSPDDILEKLSNKNYIQRLGFDNHTILALFIPNTYEFLWNTSADQFIDRMVKEYHRFWTKERRQKAKKLHLSPVEITTLASIVQKESLKKDEQPIIAGVYINRLRKGMLLQADPTVIYAIGDFSKRRLLRKDLDYDSPYNTYKYNGLPPGPICVPSRSCIDAILNYKHHRYLYFCAKEDFSGRHNFASTLSQHNRNAKKYQHALNKRKIYN